MKLMARTNLGPFYFLFPSGAKFQLDFENNRLKFHDSTFFSFGLHFYPTVDKQASS